MVVLLIYACHEISEWSVIFFVAPGLCGAPIPQSLPEESDARQALDEVNSRPQRANLSFASALVATLDARDRYTAGHSAAVAVYARDIAQRMGLPEEKQRLAHLCGPVHDIGKIGLPAGLLEKPGALILEERRQMELHWRSASASSPRLRTTTRSPHRPPPSRKDGRARLSRSHGREQHSLAFR